MSYLTNYCFYPRLKLKLATLANYEVHRQGLLGMIRKGIVTRNVQSTYIHQKRVNRNVYVEKRKLVRLITRYQATPGRHNASTIIPCVYQQV